MLFRRVPVPDVIVTSWQHLTAQTCQWFLCPGHSPAGIVPWLAAFSVHLPGSPKWPAWVSTPLLRQLSRSRSFSVSKALRVTTSPFTRQFLLDLHQPGDPSKTTICPQQQLSPATGWASKDCERFDFLVSVRCARLCCCNKWPPNLKGLQQQRSTSHICSLWVDLSPAPCYLHSRTQANEPGQPLQGTCICGRGKKSITKHRLILKASVPTSSTKQIEWPLLMSTERECEIFLPGEAPHGGATNILSVNTIYHPHFDGDLSWHHQVALEGAPWMETTSQDFTRFLPGQQRPACFLSHARHIEFSSSDIDRWHWFPSHSLRRV